LIRAQAIERNTFLRSVLGWHFTRRWLDLNYQGAYISHDVGFTDAGARPSIDSHNRFNTFLQTLEGNFALTAKASMTSGVNYTWEEGIADDFGADRPRRNRAALFTAFKWIPYTRWELAAALREELVNGSTTPVAPSLTVKFRTMPGLHVYASASRNYRIPTFNDLYWRGAGAIGNPFLKPETSLSQEAGIQYASPATDQTKAFTFKAAVFSNNVKDWILWNPLPPGSKSPWGGTVPNNTWSPQNVKKVWSRGVEAQASGKTTVAHTILEAQLQYTFTRSTNEDIYASQTSNELNKQLTFTPQHEGSATARVYWRKYTVTALASYTGKQYADGDNNNTNAVKPYTVLSAWASRHLNWRHLDASLIGEINNLLDTAYQSRPGYPLPGRNYKLTLVLQFRNLKQT
jgi:vitamin B12 transporter